MKIFDLKNFICLRIFNINFSIFFIINSYFISLKKLNYFLIDKKYYLNKFLF